MKTPARFPAHFSRAMESARQGNVVSYSAIGPQSSDSRLEFSLSPVTTDDVFEVIAEELTDSNPFFFSSGPYVETVAEWMALAA